MRMLVILVLAASCRPKDTPLQAAALSDAAATPHSSRPAHAEGGLPDELPVDDAPNQPCLRRVGAGNDRCAPPKPHFYVWDDHACAIASETVGEVSKRCDRIDPDRAVNPMNWCCP